VPRWTSVTARVSSTRACCGQLCVQSLQRRSSCPRTRPPAAAEGASTSATPSRVRCDTPSRARASTLCAVCKAVIEEIDKSLTPEQKKEGELAIEKHMFKYCDTAKGKDKTMVRVSPADGPLPPAVLRSRCCL